MPWLTRPPRQPETAVPQRDELIRPAALPVVLDADRFRHHHATLLAAAQADGGVEVYLAALNAKHRLFAEALAPEALARLDTEGIETLLDTVFLARRRLFPALAGMGRDAVVGSIEALLHGPGALTARLAAFVAAVPVPEADSRAARKTAARLRRAAHDFAADLLHFHDPERYPLLAHWVWDAATLSGALREFVRGSETQDPAGLDDTPETIEAVRAWLTGQIEALGVYRDQHFWVDLLKAAAYSNYFRAMTGGVLGSDFTRGSGPEEEITKLLGIDPAPPSGRSRVKREAPEQPKLH